MQKPLLATFVALPLLIIGTAAIAQTSHSSQNSTRSSSATEPDNTKSNKQDPSNRTATADDQKNDSTDIDLAKRIRRSVVSDKSLSTYAHNVKIVAVNGTVTLNGVVKSDEEKAQIESKAAAIAGKERVVNQLKVKS